MFPIINSLALLVFSVVVLFWLAINNIGVVVWNQYQTSEIKQELCSQTAMMRQLSYDLIISDIKFCSWTSSSLFIINNKKKVNYSINVF